jgi:hypothetical protein
MKNLFYLFSIVFFLSSCTSIGKLVDAGQYDEAISVAVQKLRGKKKKKTEHVEYLEKAFNKVTEQDLNEIEFLKDQNKPDNWDRIHGILRGIERRQNQVQPLLPLISEDGYQARFNFVRVEPMLIEAEQNSATYHYNEGKRLLDRAEQGDKIAAKRAYEEFQSIDLHFKHFKDKDMLKERALQLGMINVLIEVRNEADVVLPDDFAQELTRIDIRQLEDMWTRYYTQDPGNLNFDYLAAIIIDRLDVSPEKEKEVYYIDEKEIKDGFEYVLDKNGNVMKDSLGNDIKVDKYTKIRAEIFELYRYKAAIVSGKVVYKDLRTSELVSSRPVNVEAVFESYASKFSGDKRALSDRTKGRLRNQPQPFPSDYDLTMQAAENLKDILADELRYDLE